MRGISRIDAKGTHGWYVRVYRAGKTYSRLFSDSKYGSAERALEYAKVERQRLTDKSQPLPERPDRRLVTHDKRNKSGMVGVSRTVKLNSGGENAVYYQVTWSPVKGQIKNRQWSVRKYGEEEAARLAREFRLKVMHDIYGDVYDELMREQAELDKGRR